MESMASPLEDVNMEIEQERPKQQEEEPVPEREGEAQAQQKAEHVPVDMSVNLVQEQEQDPSPSPAPMLPTKTDVLAGVQEAAAPSESHTLANAKGGAIGDAAQTQTTEASTATLLNAAPYQQEFASLKDTIRILQQQNQQLQADNANLKQKQQHQQQGEHGAATATAAAAAQLSTYQSALSLSETQKQQLLNDNQALRARLCSLGVPVQDTNHNGLGVAVGVGGALVPSVVVDGDNATAAATAAATKMEGDAATAAAASIDITEAEALAAIDPNHAHVSHPGMNIVGVGAGVGVSINVNSPHPAHTPMPMNLATTPHHTPQRHLDLDTPNTAGLSSRSEEKWEAHFVRLVQYKREHGNCLVPTSTELGRWLCRQRHNFRYKSLKEERKQRLMDLDKTCLGERVADLEMTTPVKCDNVAARESDNGNGQGGDLGRGSETPLDSTAALDGTTTASPAVLSTLNTKTKYNRAYESKLHAKWDRYFQELVMYKNEHGHCNYPTMNGSLGRWISRQRTLYRSKKLKADRYEKLFNIGFAFEDATALEFKNKLDQQWEDMYENLLKHKQKKGHCFDVPETWPLGKWLYRQRWLYRHGNLREDRAQKLLSVGFEDKKASKKDDSGPGSGRRKRKRLSDVDVHAVGGGSNGQVLVEGQVHVEAPGVVSVNVEEISQAIVEGSGVTGADDGVLEQHQEQEPQQQHQETGTEGNVDTVINNEQEMITAAETVLDGTSGTNVHVTEQGVETNTLAEQSEVPALNMATASEATVPITVAAAVEQASLMSEV